MHARKEKIVFRLSQLTAERIDWLWPGRIAAGTLTLLDGDPEQGKSLLTLDLAARLSTGHPLPDGQAPPGPCAVVLLNSEDSHSQTVLPRLQSAQADLDRIRFFRVLSADGQDSAPTFPEDCDLLSETIRESAARLVIVDPFLAFLSANVCSVNDQRIRQALGPLADVARQTGAAILLVRHLTKTGRGQRALCRGSGAMAIIGAARTAFLAGRHPENAECHLLACTKNNLAAPPPTLAYRIDGDSAGHPVIVWEGPVPHTADEVVRSPAVDHGEALGSAIAFLEEILGPGPATSETVQRQARAAGLSERTLQRAKAQLNIVSTPKHEHGRNVWYWSLPADSDSERIMESWWGEDENV